MSEAGYTLTEMLVAMMLASLAFGGVAMASQMLAKGEQRLAASRGMAGDLRRLDGEVRSAFEQAEWFGQGEAAPNGDARHFSIGCGAGRTCGLELANRRGGALAVVKRGESERRLRLRGLVQPRLAYLTPGGELAAAPADGSLRAILLADGERRLAVYRASAEQRSDCNFDARIGGCAGSAP